MDSDLLALPHILFSAIVVIGPNFSGKLNTVYPLDTQAHAHIIDEIEG
jgi:hypothetical protein